MKRLIWNRRGTLHLYMLVNKENFSCWVKNCSFPKWKHLEPSWNRRGTVLRIAFCGMELTGTAVEPSRNHPFCYVFPHARRPHTALIIILLKARWTGTVNVYFQFLLSATSDQLEQQSMFIDYFSHLNYLIRQKACMRILFFAGKRNYLVSASPRTPSHEQALVRNLGE